MTSQPRIPALRRLASIVVALLATLAITPAHAAWQPGGVRLSPPLAAKEHVISGSVVSDGSQGVIATWVLIRSQVHEYGDAEYLLTAQRIDVAGEIPAPWPSSGVLVRRWDNFNLDLSPSIRPFPLLSDGAGGAISPELWFERVAVENQDMRLLHFYRIGTNGGPVTGTFRYSGTGLNSGPRVNGAAVDADGSGGVIFIADQRNYQVGPPNYPLAGAVYAARVDPQGNNLWPVYPIFADVGSLVGGSDDWFEVLSDGAGGAFFAWGETGPNGLPALYVQHLDANGLVPPGWPPEGRIVRNVAGSFEAKKLASNGAGGVFVVWVDHRNGQPDLFAHGVLADGSLAPGIPADGRALPSPQNIDEIHVLESDEQSGIFLVRASRNNNGTNPEARLYRLDPELLPREGWPSDGMLLTTTGSAVGLAADGLGGAFIAFRSTGAVYPVGLIGQHLSGDGSPAPGWTSGGYLLSAKGGGAGVVRSGNGAIVVWNEERTVGDYAIYAQRLVPDGPVAVQLSLVGATAEPGNVSLQWYATGAAMMNATVERRTGDTEWAALGTVSADGAGHLLYEDGSVTGGRFGYRVTWTEDGTVRHAGEVWVDVPDAWRLALSAPRPNPGSGPASFALTLADGAPASIELLDLQGRRVAHRDLGTLVPGSHVVRFEEAATLAPGIYLARLSQGVQTRTVRLIRFR